MKTTILGAVLAVLGSLPGQPIHYEAPKADTIQVQAVVTAYTSSEDETDDTPEITASGARTRHGVVACPREYAFGTKVIIKGMEYECLDRMNPRYRDEQRFDIWMESKDEAFEWGKRELAVEIIK